MLVLLVVAVSVEVVDDDDVLVVDVDLLDVELVDDELVLLVVCVDDVVVVVFLQSDNIV